MEAPPKDVKSEFRSRCLKAALELRKEGKLTPTIEDDLKKTFGERFLEEKST